MVCDRYELERSTRAPGDARRHVDGHAAELGEDAWQRARLLVSELVSNALRHGAGRIALELTPMPSLLRVSVRDEGGVVPQARVPDESGGHGLRLVEDFADRWGRGARGGLVWFEVDSATS